MIALRTGWTRWRLIKAIGIAHNDYATEDFSRWRNRIQLEVMPYELDPIHPKVQLPIGSRWQATVITGGDYTVRDEQDRLVCQGNFETGEMGEPMNFAKAEEFQRMVQGRSRDLLRGELQK